MEIPSTKPFFSDESIKAISGEIEQVLKSGNLILGPYTSRFEASFKEYCGVKRAVGVSSCTAALEIVLRYFDVTDSDVVVPTNTFIATSNAVLYAGGHPVLADINPDTLCLDPKDLQQRITPQTKGVIVVHLAGLPCPDVNEIHSICRENGLFLIEDVAHAHGGTIGGRKTGSIGDAGCFSFYPTKVMTTCTGGMITTNDDKLANYAVSLRHHGVGSGLTQIVNLGNDWLMNEVDAVLGFHQLAALENNLRQRNDIASQYSTAFEDCEWASTFRVPADIRHSYYKYPVLLSPAIDRQQLNQRMKKERGIALGSVYDPPCHLQPVYQRIFGYRDGMFPVADNILKRVCCLPMYPQMTATEVKYVVDSLSTLLPACKKETAIV
ncbi:MAG: DegT/DnrJ/EryC1/StrS family aminotransferase [Dehalococcoidales bacterium]|nr:DegT/DnrJ/EryC1/StrS family aminotransferase [Dehalococcoidales bacterium]